MLHYGVAGRRLVLLPSVFLTAGDMGHNRNNNMQNLLANCNDGTVDAILHMGDHCYDFDRGNYTAFGFDLSGESYWNMTTDRRGDAYMNVFQPVLQGCPWMPV